eukprot:7950059-Pyramimonas_sp.AAC.1
MAPTCIESKAFFQSSATIAVLPSFSACAKSTCLRAACIASEVPRPRRNPNCVFVSLSSAPASCDLLSSRLARSL